MKKSSVFLMAWLLLLPNLTYANSYAPLANFSAVRAAMQNAN